MRTTLWISFFLLLGLTLNSHGSPASVGIGDDCPTPHPCFSPASVTIDAGEAVTFYYYADTVPTGRHNVVADDHSFRCARGCDGEGGDGTPLDWNEGFGFTRTFRAPGRITYHDEVSGATGEIIVRPTSTAILGMGFTGAWFDPAQSGHGLLLEVLPGDRLLAAWLAFDPSGAQAWFIGVGTYSGNTATISSMEQPGGGRWIPNFDAAQIVRKPWGTLTFTFTDCEHGRVDFNSSAGFGTGSMNLTRLTLPAGIWCPSS